jgi:hypothetical protein
MTRNEPRSGLTTPWLLHDDGGDSDDGGGGSGGDAAAAVMTMTLCFWPLLRRESEIPEYKAAVHPLEQHFM